MRTKVEGRRKYNIIYIIAIIIVLFSNFFSNKLSILLMLKPNYKFKNETEIHFIDVGQGDAIAIKFDNGKTMLIDTGTIEYQKKLGYYLDNIILDKSKTIDYLVLTHTDIDHSGNMMYILENYDVKTFYRPMIYSSLEDPSTLNTNDWYDRIVSYAKEKEIEMIFNEQGLSIKDGFNSFTWLSPVNISHDVVLESNEYSPVIRFDYKNHSALFTGDISSEIENNLLFHYSDTGMLDVDILKVAHHGSAYSTNEKFLEEVSPEYACISVGENTYGHPANQLLSRILDYDKVSNSNLYSNLYTTEQKGNVIFTLSWNIEVDFIDQIDNYSFNNYYTYSIIIIVVIVIFLTKPYYKAYKKDIRFVLQNKRYKNLKEKENNKNEGLKL